METLKLQKTSHIRLEGFDAFMGCFFSRHVDVAAYRKYIAARDLDWCGNAAPYTDETRIKKKKEKRDDTQRKSSALLVCDQRLK